MAFSSDDILDRVTCSLDCLLQSSDRYQGLFPSVLDVATGRMPSELPPPIKGQRSGDRSYPGSNLMHDEPTLLTLYGLATALDRPDYAEAADRYLRRFAEHCARTPNGLFPWGEHAFWNLVTDDLNEAPIHDHLRQAPLWLWEKLFAFQPDCVVRFAEGLDCHWVSGDPPEYCRHAPMDAFCHWERHSLRSCDFPRHSGFYVFDLAFAYARTGRADLLEQVRAFTDYWWSRRDADGLLLAESRSPDNLKEFYNINAPGQTLSLGVSLLESAVVLDDFEPALAREMQERGKVYALGFLAAPHDPENGLAVLGHNRCTGEIVHRAPVWGSVYGLWPASYLAVTCLCAFRLCEEARLYDWAAAAGRAYLEEEMPAGVATPSMDAGLAIALLADLYDISRDSVWLDGAMALAEPLKEAYLDSPLPRGAVGIDWYESQMGPGFLLHGLARLALLSRSADDCPLPPDYTAR